MISKLIRSTRAYKPGIPLNSTIKYNPNVPSYYSTFRLFVNEFRQSSVFLNGNENSLGWIDSLAPGAYVDTIVMMGSGFGLVRTGKYYCTWDDPNLNIDFLLASSNVTNPQNEGVRKKSVVVSQPQNDAECNFIPYVGEYLVYIRVQNISASPVSINEQSGIAVYHADDEQQFLNGDIFQASALSALSGAKALRFLDWFGTNLHTFQSEPVLNPIHFKTPAHRRWATDLLCIEHAAKLCELLNTKMILTLPVKSSTDTFTWFANQINAHFTGHVITAYGNESWNFAYPYALNRAWLRDTKSLTLTNPIVNNYGNISTLEDDKVACAVADGNLQMLKCFRDVLGDSRVDGCFEHWAVNPTTMGGGFEYTSPYHGDGTNIKTKHVLKYSAVTNYFSTSSGNGATYASADELISTKSWNNTDAWWKQVLENGINDCVTMLTNHLQMVKSKHPSIIPITYEGGFHTPIFTNTSNLSMTVDYTDLTLLNCDRDLTAYINDPVLNVYGEKEIITFAYMDPFPGPVNHWTNYFVKRISSTSVKIYASKTDYANDNPILFTVGGGKLTLILIGRMARITNRIYNLMNGPIGLELTQKLYNDSKTKVAMLDQFGVVGEHTSTSFWSITPSQYIPHSQIPRWEYWKNVGENT